MNKQRVAWLLMMVAGGILIALWWVNRQRPRKPQAPAPTTQPVASPPGPAATTAPATTQLATTTPTTAPAPAPASAPAVADRAEWLQDTSGLGPQNTFAAGSLDPNSGYLFQALFVREGAAVANLKLSGAFATDADKRLFGHLRRDHQRYEQARRKDPKTYRGHYSLLNGVRSPLDASKNYLPFATRSITVGVKGSPARPTTIYLDEMQWRHAATEAVTQPADGVEVRFATDLYRDAHHDRPDAKAAYQPALRLTKAYRIVKDDYTIGMRLKAENLCGKPLHVYIDQLGPTGVPREELYRPQDDRFAVYGRFQAEDGKILVKQEAHSKLQAADTNDAGQRVYEVATGRPIAIGRSDEGSPVLWIGQANKFFASMLYLRPTIDERIAAAGWQADYYFTPAHETPNSRAHVTGLRIGGRRPDAAAFVHAPALLLPPGGGKEMAFEVFAGPKKRDMFSETGAPHYRKLYDDLNYIGTINFRSCFCSWNALTLGMMWLLQNISRFALGNYGVAIMILVVLVRLVLHPLTKKSQVNMMKMQKLQPEMARLREKYANDKETLQKEMMKFYKQQGATPLLGCAPMLLQMPIWIALWGSLSAAVELRHAAFLPVWLTDLAAPDALVIWQTPLTLPLLGGLVGPIRSFNLLPLLLTVAMFLQTKFNPQMSQPSAAAKPEQEKQKKMMQIMMPVMMLLFFYNAASGLTLYIMTSTFAGVAEQFIIRKHIRAKEEVEAATVTTVKVPGKGPRGNRPKKPKGPFYIKHG